MIDTMIERRGNKMGDLSTERVLGELTGTIVGIKESLSRIEREQERQGTRMEEIAMSHETVKAEAKLGIKILAAVATASSIGGAGAHHVIQAMLK